MLNYFWNNCTHFSFVPTFCEGKGRVFGALKPAVTSGQENHIKVIQKFKQQAIKDCYIFVFQNRYTILFFVSNDPALF
jgi:hypothetical protein